MNKLKSGHCVYLEIYTHPMRVCINLLNPNLQDLVCNNKRGIGRCGIYMHKRA